MYIWKKEWFSEFITALFPLYSEFNSVIFLLPSLILSFFRSFSSLFVFTDPELKYERKHFKGRLNTRDTNREKIENEEKTKWAFSGKRRTDPTCHGSECSSFHGPNESNLIFLYEDEIERKRDKLDQNEKKYKCHRTCDPIPGQIRWKELFSRFFSIIDEKESRGRKRRRLWLRMIEERIKNVCPVNRCHLI